GHPWSQRPHLRLALPCTNRVVRRCSRTPGGIGGRPPVPAVGRKGSSRFYGGRVCQRPERQACQTENGCRVEQRGRHASQVTDSTVRPSSNTIRPRLAQPDIGTSW